MNLKPILHRKNSIGTLYKNQTILYQWQIEIENTFYQIELLFAKYLFIFQFILKINNKIIANKTCFGGLNKHFTLQNAQLQIIKKLDKPCKLIINGKEFKQLNTYNDSMQNQQKINQQNKISQSDPQSYKVQNFEKNQPTKIHNSLYENSNIFFPSKVEILRTQDPNSMVQRVPINRLFKQLHIKNTIFTQVFKKYQCLFNHDQSQLNIVNYKV